MYMRIIGSSGNSCTPWPLCMCRVCERARTQGGQDVRYGNHLYLPEIGLLTDTSEHIFSQLNRFSITDVRRLVITHWHPDHAAGLRIIQAISGTFLNPQNQHLDLYMTRAVYDEIKEKISPAIDYYLENSNTTLIFLEDGVAVPLDGWVMTPVTAPEQPSGPHTITSFLFEKDGYRVFFAPDETKHLALDRDELTRLDVLIKEIGYFTRSPSGERILSEEVEMHIPHELSFEENLEHIKSIGAKRTILTELEEAYLRTHEDYEALTKEHPELALEIAYDGMEID